MAQLLLIHYEQLSFLRINCRISDLSPKGGCVPQALCETAQAYDADETYPALVL